jgi:nitroreductase
VGAPKASPCQRIVQMCSVWIQTVAAVKPGSEAMLWGVKEDVLKFLRGLRAVREYTSEPVSEQAIEQILEVGRWTSTGGNRQPSEVVVVRDPQVRQKFADWGAKPAGAAPVSLLLVTTSDPSAFDEGRLAERLALAARAFGLGSGISTLKNEGPEAAKQLLGIPAERRARTIVAVGHTDVEARRALPKLGASARKPIEEFAHWDKY